MEFCPKCGSLMFPQKRNGTEILVCNNCGFEMNQNAKAKDAYMLKNKIKHTPKEETVIIKQEVHTMPSLNLQCPKCGNIGVYYWQVQTRSADEPPTTFYRCKKCGYTWREY